MGWIILIDILLIIVIALMMSVEADIKIDEYIRIKVKYAWITIFSMSTDEKDQKKKKPEKKKAKKDKKSDEQAADTPPDAKPDTEAIRQDTPPQQKEESVERDNTVSKEYKASSQSTDSGKSEEVQSEKSDIPDKDKSDKSEEKPSLFGDSLSEKWEFIKMLLDGAGKPVKRLISHIRITDLKINVIASGEDAAAAAINFGKINILINSILSLLYRLVRLKVKKVNIGCDFDAGETKYFVACKVKMRLSTAIGCAIWLVGRIAIRYIKLIKGNKAADTADSRKQEGI